MWADKNKEKERKNLKEIKGKREGRKKRKLNLFTKISQNSNSLPGVRLMSPGSEWLKCLQLSQ